MTLEERMRDILARLSVLANGDTMDLDPDKRFDKHAESGPPAGVSLRPADKPPPKDQVSLYEWYCWQFKRHAGDPISLSALCDLAEDDYQDFRFKADHRIELRKGELLDNDPRDGGAADRAQAKRVVEWYEGKPPLYVAWRESEMGAKVSEAWVRKARRDHDRNPEDGRKRAEFLDLDDDQRQAAVAKLAARGMSQQKVADRLGVGKRTVQRHWPERAMAV